MIRRCGACLCGRLHRLRRTTTRAIPLFLNLRLTVRNERTCAKIRRSVCRLPLQWHARVAAAQYRATGHSCMRVGLLAPQQRVSVLHEPRAPFDESHNKMPLVGHTLTLTHCCLLVARAKLFLTDRVRGSSTGRDHGRWCGLDWCRLWCKRLLRFQTRA